MATPGVLANDSDADGDPLTAALVTGPAHGTLTLNPNGSFVYTPPAGFTGQDSFTYTASDGALTSNVATVTIMVTPKILFASTRDGNSEIYVMKSDGGGVTRLTTNTAADTNPVWSPNHRRIAFTSTRDGNPEIYLMPATGEGSCQVKACTIAKRLTNNSTIDTSPTWLGTRIVFTTTRDDPNSEIYTMQADGTALTRLTANPAGDTFPDW